MRTLLFAIALFAVLWAIAFWTIMTPDEGGSEPLRVELAPIGTTAQPELPGPRSTEAQSTTAPRMTAAALDSRAALRSWAAGAGAAGAAREAPPADAAPPDAFPLSEWQWRDADPDETWLEPFVEEAGRPESDPFEDPWGGAWSDRGGA